MGVQSMDLNAARIFVRVVRLGSFTKAARDLGLPNSTVSDRVSALEKELGVSLLVRTTRRIHLTEAGAAFFEKAELAVAALLRAGEESSSFQKRPAGTLRITTTADFDHASLCDAVIEYRRAFPDVNVELCLTERVVDMAREGFDIAIRASAVTGSNLTAKRLGESGLILVASRRYLQKAPAIRQPTDLRPDECLVISSEGGDDRPVTWNLVSGSGETRQIKPSGRIASNSTRTIKHLAIIGQGIALMPPTLVHEEIAKGSLVRVLPAWSTPPSPIYLVYAAGRLASPKVKEMIPLLEPRVRKVIR